MSKLIHQFDNGVKVYSSHLIPVQIERYCEKNLHEPEEEQWFEQLLQKVGHQPAVFIDIGAAIGYYVILARKISPELEIHAFEPLVEHREKLVDNLRLNNVDMNGIYVHSLAVAADCSSANLRKAGYGSSLIRRQPRQWLWGLLRRSTDRTQATVEEVETVRLDIFLERLNKPIELIKIDVQGWEKDVLRGAEKTLRAKVVRKWIIGTHSSRLHTKCAEILSSNGYQLIFDEQEVVGQPDGLIVACLDTLENVMQRR